MKEKLRQGALLLLAGVVAAGAQSEEAVTGGKPNVLMIAIDDLNDWVGFLEGHPQTLTPNLDRLAKQGMVFENAHCTVPSCNPSRSAIMSGIAPWVSGLYSNSQVMRENEVLKDAVMMPEYFGEHGYYTLSRGKIFHHHDLEKESWHYWSNQRKDKIEVPKEELTDMSPYAGVEIVGELLPKRKTQVKWSSTQEPKELTRDYQNSIWAAQWLLGERKEEKEKPFFMACGIFLPHLPFTVPAEYFERIKLEDVTLPPIKEDYKDGEVLAKPTLEYKDAREKGLREEVVWAYLASIAYADDCVGHILDALEKSPHRDNTIVVLWSDHGWHVGEKMRYKKTTPWERATRSPFIIKAPGMKPGRTNRPVGLLDMFPTLVDLTGIPSKKELSGRSLKKLLIKPDTKWPHPAITQVGGRTFSLRSEQYRYIVNGRNEPQLFDLVADPSEWENLARDEAYAEVMATFESQVPVKLN